MPTQLRNAVHTDIIRRRGQWFELELAIVPPHEPRAPAVLVPLYVRIDNGQAVEKSFEKPTVFNQPEV